MESWLWPWRGARGTRPSLAQVNLAVAEVTQVTTDLPPHPHVSQILGVTLGHNDKGPSTWAYFHRSPGLAQGLRGPRSRSNSGNSYCLLSLGVCRLGASSPHNVTSVGVSWVLLTRRESSKTLSDQLLHGRTIIPYTILLRVSGEELRLSVGL